MEKNNLASMISGVLAVIFWVLFVRYEYNQGIYADVHRTTGDILDGWSIPLFIAALVLTGLSIWLYRRSPNTKADN